MDVDLRPPSLVESAFEFEIEFNESVEDEADELELDFRMFDEDFFGRATSFL